MIPTKESVDGGGLDELLARLEGEAVEEDEVVEEGGAEVGREEGVAGGEGEEEDGELADGARGGVRGEEEALRVEEEVCELAGGERGGEAAGEGGEEAEGDPEAEEEGGEGGEEGEEELVGAEEAVHGEEGALRVELLLLDLDEEEAEEGGAEQLHDAAVAEDALVLGHDEGDVAQRGLAAQRLQLGGGGGGVLLEEQVDAHALQGALGGGDGLRRHDGGHGLGVRDRLQHLHQPRLEVLLVQRPRRAPHLRPQRAPRRQPPAHEPQRGAEGHGRRPRRGPPPLQPPGGAVRGHGLGERVQHGVAMLHLGAKRKIKGGKRGSRIRIRNRMKNKRITRNQLIKGQRERERRKGKVEVETVEAGEAGGEVGGLAEAVEDELRPADEEQEVALQGLQVAQVVQHEGLAAHLPRGRLRGRQQPPGVAPQHEPVAGEEVPQRRGEGGEREGEWE